MSDRIIEAVATLDKVCEHFNVPAQAGDDEVLRRMRRGYTVDDYRKLIAKIREKVPGCSLATDIIVGFPGETEEQFQHTLDLLAEIKFDVVHVARYSPRPGTFGAKFLPDDVPPEEKKRRHRAVEELQEKIAAEINARLLGQTVEVLVEGRQKDKWYGRTRTNKLVFFPAEGNLLGELVQVRIEKTSPWALQGTLAVPAAVA
jgi:tRNA-2-methylthio-N6-dimethylallyladenosine synthase